MRELKIDKSITQRDHDTLARYLMDMKKIPLLTAEEEVALAIKIKAGDSAALNKLVVCNLRFTVSVAKKYEGQGILLPDLIAEGNLGLIKAARRFDHTKGFKFISFAVWWIRQSMLHAIAEHKRTIRLPANQISDITEIWRAEQLLEQQLERLPTIEELSDYLEMDIDKIKLCQLSNANTCSLDYNSEDDEKQGMLAVLEDVLFSPADSGLVAEGLAFDLNRALHTLPDRQRAVLQLQYGLNGRNPMYVADIADLMGVSSQCVTMNRKKALTSLRKNPETAHLIEYV
ncbi:MAG: RNA polymerase sigma factor RpoD/SigA [Bacteroidota bacterium]